MLLLIMQLFAEYRSGLRHQDQDDESKTTRESGVKHRRKANSTALVILQICAPVPLIWLFGMSVGTAIFCLAYLRWQAEESWKFSIIFSFALAFLLHAGFTGLLHIALYPGIVTRVLT